MKIRGFEKVSEEVFLRDSNDVNLNINYKELNKPKRGTKYSAGYDFYSPYDFIIKPNEEIKVKTAIKAYMQEDEYLKIVVRSGHGFKYNIRLKNQVGIIDSDYYNNSNNEGHIIIALKNEGEKDFVIKKGEAFAQGIFQKYLLVDDDEFVFDTRIGGFNSTSK